MKSLLLALSVCALPCLASEWTAFAPVATDPTTLVLRNSSDVDVRCAATYLPSRSVPAYDIPARQTVVELLDEGTAGVLRFDCSAEVVIAVRIRDVVLGPRLGWSEAELGFLASQRVLYEENLWKLPR